MPTYNNTDNGEDYTAKQNTKHGQTEELVPDPFLDQNNPDSQ